MLGRLPKSECPATGWLALAGATISLGVPDDPRAAKYIGIAESRRASAKPQVKLALALNLAKLRALNGLPACEGDRPADDETIALGKQRRLFREAVSSDDSAAAIKALKKVVKLIPEIDDFLMQRGVILSAIAGFARLGLTADLAKYVAAIDRGGDGKDLDSGALAAMGHRDLANKRAESRIVGHLKKLKTNPDPNIHFPVNEICEELWFLWRTGATSLAAKLLRRTVREFPDWPGVRGGFAVAGSLSMLAEVVAEVVSPEEAVKLLGLATSAAKVEPHRGFRKGAKKAVEEQLPTPGLAAAIERAKGIKNAAKRREELIPLLTRKGAWGELAQLLDELPNIAAQCDAVHSVLYAIPGGPRLM